MEDPAKAQSGEETPKTPKGNHQGPHTEDSVEAQRGERESQSGEQTVWKDNFCGQQIPRAVVRAVFWPNLGVLAVVFVLHVVRVLRDTRDFDLARTLGTGLRLFASAVRAMMALVSFLVPVALAFGVHGICRLNTMRWEVKGNTEEIKVFKSMKRLSAKTRRNEAPEFRMLRKAQLQTMSSWSSCSKWRKFRSILAFLLGFGSLVALSVGVALTLYKQKMRHFLAHPDSLYRDVFSSYACRFGVLKGDCDLIQFDAEAVLYFHGVNCTMAFVIFIGIQGMWLNYQTCSRAIHSVVESMKIKTEEKDFGNLVDDIHELNDELLQIWKGSTGWAWAVALLAQFIVMLTGLLGLMVNWIQWKNRNLPQQKQDVGFISSAFLVFVGGTQSLLTIFFLSQLTSLCMSPSGTSIFAELDRYCKPWFRNPDRNHAWMSEVLAFQTSLRSRQMGVNLLGVLFVDFSFFATRAMRGLILAPSAYVVLTAFLESSAAAHARSHHDSNSTAWQY